MTQPRASAGLRSHAAAAAHEQWKGTCLFSPAWSLRHTPALTLGTLDLCRSQVHKQQVCLIRSCLLCYRGTKIGLPDILSAGLLTGIRMLGVL